MKQDADIDIMMDQERENLQITSNKKMVFLNENHLFEAMGLTGTNEEELNELFSDDITRYLKEEIVSSPVDSHLNKSKSEDIRIDSSVSPDGPRIKVQEIQSSLSKSNSLSGKKLQKSWRLSMRTIAPGANRAWRFARLIVSN